MRGQAHHRSAVFTLVLTALMALGAAPAIGTAPQPVIPTGEAPQQGGDGSAAQESPCPGGSSVAVAGAQLVSSSVGSGHLATYPGPVLPVDPGDDSAPASTDCIAELSLSLIVKSPNERKPEGADASLDELAVPRAALESGFAVSLPAQSRTISLSEPGKDWELVGTSCSCAGSGVAGSTGVLLASSGIGSGQLATYPGPVLPVGPGGGGCSGPGGSASAMATPTVTASMVPTEGSLGHPPRTTYPGPVLPVGPGAPEGPAPRNPAQLSWGSDGAVTISDPDRAGGSFDCTWTVELVNGRFTVKTITKPPGAEGRFKYRVTPTGLNALKASPTTMRGASDEESLRSGPWSVELHDFDDAWKVKKSSCSESDGTTPSVAAGSTASIGVDLDDNVQCTFELELLTPKAGPWHAVNKRGATTCRAKGRRSFTFPIKRETGTGRIAVKSGGDRLVATTDSTNGLPITVNRSEGDPRRYVGTERLTFAGVKMRFEVTYDVLTEERIKGSLIATWNDKGARCTTRRPFELTYVGK